MKAPQNLMTCCGPDPPVGVPPLIIIAHFIITLPRVILMGNILSPVCWRVSRFFRRSSAL